MDDPLWGIHASENVDSHKTALDGTSPAIAHTEHYNLDVDVATAVGNVWSDLKEIGNCTF